MVLKLNKTISKEANILIWKYTGEIPLLHLFSLPTEPSRHAQLPWASCYPWLVSISLSPLYTPSSVLLNWNHKGNILIPQIPSLQSLLNSLWYHQLPWRTLVSSMDPYSENIFEHTVVWQAKLESYSSKIPIRDLLPQDLSGAYKLITDRWSSWSNFALDWYLRWTPVGKPRRKSF